MTRLILASRSAARIALLSNAGIDFETLDAGVDETALKSTLLEAGRTPAEIAAALADAKALAVPAPNSERVIGADQTLELNGRLFDKPANLGEAREQLLALRGRSHRLHSAVATAEGGVIAWRALASAALAVRPFSDAFLDRYLESEGEAILGCVGGYRLEGLGAQLFDRIEGDYFTILGLPLLPLLGHLRAAEALAA